MAKFDLKEYARRGAIARIAELQAELTEIFRAFPGLRTGRGARRGRPPKSDTAVSNAAAPRRRRRRRSPMTAEQRKAVSARMKRYWAERRRAKSSK